MSPLCFKARVGSALFALGRGVCDILSVKEYLRKFNSNSNGADIAKILHVYTQKCALCVSIEITLISQQLIN